ncbi:hypothetical protein F4781DRAFT_389101 [Annulohypoxylon bovei var. microspora]|nr:hypothetical protein F4781DRAFT_389101 [Annulohypoxylon bovei var. microspora]
MCTETAYTLRCEHVVTRTLYCSDAPPPSRRSCGERRTCIRVFRNAVPWPPPPQFGTQCPLANCPFEERGGHWNCCWCGKEWNNQGESRQNASPEISTICRF